MNKLQKKGGGGNKSFNKEIEDTNNNQVENTEQKNIINKIKTQ